MNKDNVVYIVFENVMWKMEKKIKNETKGWCVSCMGRKMWDGGGSSFMERCDFSSALLWKGWGCNGPCSVGLWDGLCPSAPSALVPWLCLGAWKGDYILMDQAPLLTVSTFIVVLAPQSPECLGSLWTGDMGWSFSLWPPAVEVLGPSTDFCRGTSGNVD